MIKLFQTGLGCGFSLVVGALPGLIVGGIIGAFVPQATIPVMIAATMFFGLCFFAFMSQGKGGRVSNL